MFSGRQAALSNSGFSAAGSCSQSTNSKNDNNLHTLQSIIIKAQ